MAIGDLGTLAGSCARGCATGTPPEWDSNEDDLRKLADGLLAYPGDGART